MAASMMPIRIRFSLPVSSMTLTATRAPLKVALCTLPYLHTA